VTDWDDPADLGRIRLTDKARNGAWARRLLQVFNTSLKRRLLSHSVWTAAGTGAFQSSMIVASILIARSLGHEALGQFGYIQGTIAMFGTFVGSALATTTSKLIAEYRDVDPKRAGRVVALNSISSLSVSLLAALMLVLAAPSVGGAALAAHTLQPALRAAALLLLFHTWNGAQQGVIAGFEQFRSLALINIARGVGTIVFTLIGARTGGLVGVVHGLALSAGICCAVSAFTIKKLLSERGITSRWAHAWRERSVLYMYSLPALLTGAMISPANWLVYWALAKQHNGFLELGMFSAANQWRLAVCMIPAVLAQASLPVMSNFLGGRNQSGYWRTVKLTIALSAAMAGGLALVGCLLSRQILSYYGRGFEVGVAVFILLQGAAVLNSTGNAISSAITGQGKMWANLSLNILWGSILVIMVYAGMCRTAVGAASAYLVAYLLQTVCQGVYLVRLIGNRPEVALLDRARFLDSEASAAARNDF
jgi:O-antigen/teichoic acid export membrane protein